MKPPVEPGTRHRCGAAAILGTGGPARVPFQACCASALLAAANPLPVPGDPAAAAGCEDVDRAERR
jgi:hypothetical protein